MAELPGNIVEILNQRVMGFDRAMGLRFIKVEPGELTAELDVGDHHRQPYGLAHGGVYSGMIETVCSTGAALSVFAEGKSTVGLENSTSYLRAVREGTVTCTATPVYQGRRSQVWEASICDHRSRQVARGRVRLLVLEEGAAADGATVELSSPLEQSGGAADPD